MKAISKNGTEITAAYETTPCIVAVWPDSFTRNANGELEAEPDGSGSDMCWNDQHPSQRDGKDLWLDEAGDDYTTDEIAIVDDDFDLDEMLADYDRLRLSIAGAAAIAADFDPAEAARIEGVIRNRVEGTDLQERSWYIVREINDAMQSCRWSNADGWIIGDNYDRFTDTERQQLNLPIGGKWQELR